MMTDASCLTAKCHLGTRLAAPAAIPTDPRDPARLGQIVGVNGGNGVSKAMPRHIVDAIAGANLP
jgi:hypothetical protein